MTDTFPKTMQAAHFDAPGKPDVIHLAELPTPQPGPGEVLVKVAFAGVNRPDIIQRQGFYPPPPGASPLLGLEVSGEVVAVGAGVDPVMLGQRVCALTPGGGYAQYCRVPAGHCLPVPDGLPMDQAAALPETLFTVWHNVFERGYASQGETILVHGGTSGIGSMAIMLGKLAAARTSAPPRWKSVPITRSITRRRTLSRKWRESLAVRGLNWCSIWLPAIMWRAT